MNNHVMEIPLSYDVDSVFAQFDIANSKALTADDKRIQLLRKIQKETGINIEFYGWFNGQQLYQRRRKDSKLWVLVSEDQLEAAEEQGFYEPDWI